MATITMTKADQTTQIVYTGQGPLAGWSYTIQKTSDLQVSCTYSSALANGATWETLITNYDNTLIDFSKSDQSTQVVYSGINNNIGESITVKKTSDGSISEQRYVPAALANSQTWQDICSWIETNQVLG